MSNHDANFFRIPPKCDVCSDTGEVKVRAQYHTKNGRACRDEMRPCPFCENGQAMDRKQNTNTGEA